MNEKVKLVRHRTLAHKLVFVFFICLQFIPLFSVGQSIGSYEYIDSLIDSTQKIYGKSDLLVNGSAYYQPNRQASGSPFLFLSVAEQGTVFTRGKTFTGVGLNYDIVNQKLLLLNIMPNKLRVFISLSDILIDSFLINDFIYISSSKLNIKSNNPYLISINSGSYRMFVGYKKEFINRYNERNPYGKFSSIKQDLFLVSDSISKRVNSKQALIETFPEAKKDISRYLRKHKIKLSRATPEELKQLMHFYNKKRESVNE